jgi:hypothetical protein
MAMASLPNCDTWHTRRQVEHTVQEGKLGHLPTTGALPGFVYVHSETAKRESMRIHYPYGDASERSNDMVFERKDTRDKIRCGGHTYTHHK